MKKKILCFISLAFIFLPCILLLSACGAPKETGFRVLLNGEVVNSSEIEVFYGDDIDLDVVSLLDDGTTTDISESSFVLTDENGIVGTTPSVGSYSLAVKYEEYDIIKFSVIVNPKKISMPTIGASVEYAGREQNCPLIGFDSELMNIADNTATIVGNYTAVVSLKDATNYVWAETNNNFELYYNWGIVKKRLVKPVTGQALEYNSQDQNYSIQGFDENTMAVSGEITGTIVDEYIVTISLKDKDNYCWVDTSTDDISVKWNIEKCKLEKPVAVEREYVYNAIEQTFEISGYDEETMMVSGDIQTNAGTHKVVVSIKDKDNYCWSDGTDENIEFDFVIEKYKLQSPIATQTTYTYKKTEQTFEITRFDDETMIISGNVQTNAGTHKVVVSIKDKDNYCWSDGTDENIEFDFVIEKFRLEKPVAVDKVYTYNTEEQIFELIGFDEETMNVSGNKHINASESYNVVVTIADKNNYCWTSGTIEDIAFNWIINKAQAVAPMVDALSGTYSPNQALKDFDLPENFVWVDEDIIPTVPMTKYLAKYNPNSLNYLDDEVEIDLHLEKYRLEKPIAVEKTYTYNKTEQTFEMTGFDEETMVVSGNVKRNAGEYAVEVSVKDETNYTWTDDSSSFSLTWKILKQGVEMLEQKDYVFTWTGNAIEFVPDDFDEQMFNIGDNIQSEVGTHNAVILIKDTVNYEWSDKAEGGKNLAFEIIRATPVITFAEENIDKTYDGKIINVPRLNYSDLYLAEWGEDARFVDVADDITLSYEIKDGDEYKAIESSDENFANAGYYRATMVMPETAHFKSITLTKEFKIYNVVKQSEYEIFVLDQEKINYDGTAKEPAVELYKWVEYSRELIDPSLYTVTYSNNIEVGQNALITITFKDELLVGELHCEFGIFANDLISEILVEGKPRNPYYYFDVDNTINHDTVELELFVNEKYLTTDGDKKYFDGEFKISFYNDQEEYYISMNEEGRFVCQIPINENSVSIYTKYKDIDVYGHVNLDQKIKNSTYISSVDFGTSADVFSYGGNCNLYFIRGYADSDLEIDLDSINIAFNNDYVLVGKSLNADKTKLTIETKRKYYANSNVTLVYDLVYSYYDVHRYDNIEEIYVYGINGQETYEFVNKKVTINSLSSLDLLMVEPGAGEGNSRWSLSKGSTIIVDNQEFFDYCILPISSAGTYKLTITGQELGSGTYTIVVNKFVEAFNIKLNQQTYRLLGKTDYYYSYNYGDFYVQNNYTNILFYTFAGTIDSETTKVNVEITSMFDCYNSEMEKLTNLKKVSLDVMTDEGGQRYVEIIVDFEGTKSAVRLYLIAKPKSGADFVIAIGNKVFSFDRDVFYGDGYLNVVSGDFTYKGHDENYYYQYFVTSVSASKLGEICSKDNNITGNIFLLRDISFEVTPSWGFSHNQYGIGSGDFVLEDTPDGFKQIEIVISGHLKLIIKITNN